MKKSTIIRMSEMRIKIEAVEEQLLRYYNKQYNEPYDESTEILISIIERRLEKLTKEHKELEESYIASIEEDIKRSMRF